MTHTDTPTATIADLQLRLHAAETRDEYNGWVNRETWATHLHLSNDQDLYTIAVRLVQQADRDVHEFYADMDCDMPPIAQTNLAAERIEEWVGDMVDDYHDHERHHTTDLMRSMIQDVGSFWRVDWQAVADAFRDDA